MRLYLAFFLYQVKAIPRGGKGESFRMTLCAMHQNDPDSEMDYPNRSIAAM
jgi:hypothetical protein